MSKDRQIIGESGEKEAVEFLEKKGYKIIGKRWRKRGGEIDILAFDPEWNEYVFVEVKTRRSQTFGFPEESVNGKKLEKIERTALRWLKEKELESVQWRVDVIAIERKPDSPSVHHIKNVSY